MSSPQISILGGKVLKQSLPVFDGPPPVEAAPVKRLMLTQGELSQFWDDESPVHYIAFVELRDGCVRGNHFHQIKREFFYVISGEVLLVVEDVETRVRDAVALHTGDLATIGTGIAHAFQTVNAGKAIEFSKARFSHSDIHQWPLC
jgi:mannose-6-phosphate isomerase-like protein (cupin superfamily)